MDIQKAREQGDDVSKQIKTLRDLMSDGGLVEKQNKAADMVSSSVGQRIEDIEKMRPVYSADPELSDVDNMKDMLIGFIGSTTRALGKNNSYVKEFEDRYSNYGIDIIENTEPETDVGDTNG